MRSPTHTSRRRWLPAAAILSTLGLVVAAALPASADSGDSASKKLRTGVTAAGVSEHLRAFDAIATANDDTRASGTPGYAASRDYVVGKLRAAGYKPVVQSFDFPFFKENAPSTLRQVSPDATTYDNPDDFSTMTYSASGSVSGQVVPVDTALAPTDTSTSGCEDALLYRATASAHKLFRMVAMSWRYFVQRTGMKHHFLSLAVVIDCWWCPRKCTAGENLLAHPLVRSDNGRHAEKERLSRHQAWRD